jgi:1,4-dihydroxy-2-naphthoate polyprenyltransferase
MIAFIKLGRPLFLAGGVLFHALGVAIALSTGAPLDLMALLWGQAAITAIQSMTLYSNEYFDLPADLANSTPTRWSGGSRVLPAGVLAARVALYAALTLAGLAIGAAITLMLLARPGPLALPLLGLALLLGWSYSAPPARLHSRGLGELTTALLVPGLTPLVGFYLQTGRLAALPLLASAPLCCLQFASMLAIEFPDAAGDTATGKRTLVVRLGGERAARLLALALLLAYTALPAVVLAGLPVPATAGVALSAPVAVWQARRVLAGAWADPARWESLGFWSISLVMGPALAQTAAFMLLAWLR